MLDDYFTFNEKISRDYAGSCVEGLDDVEGEERFKRSGTIFLLG